MTSYLGSLLVVHSNPLSLSAYLVVGVFHLCWEKSDTPFPIQIRQKPNYRTTFC